MLRSFLKISLTITALLISVVATAQSKLYVAGGIALASGGGTSVTLGEFDEGEYFKFDHQVVDIEYTRRVMGSFGFVAGLSYFNAGYDANATAFGSASKLKMSYLGIPLMARWNIGNKNMFLVDAGIEPSFLLNAYLKESIVQFNTVKECEGNITPYSNRFYYAWKVQTIVPFNRFYFGVFYSGLIGEQTSLRDLKDHWGLNAQQSTYLLSNGYSKFGLIGFKLGIRLR